MKIYFTFGTSGQPFRDGWVEIEAPSRKLAVAIFKELYPNPDNDFINCADIYTEKQFKNTEMYSKGNFGSFCHAAYSLVRKEVIQNA